jgi:hypothetical protein
VKRDLQPADAREFAIGLIEKDVEKDGKVPFSRAEEIIEMFNSKYNAGLSMQKALAALEKKGFFVSNETIFSRAPKPKTVLDKSGKEEFLETGQNESEGEESEEESVLEEKEFGTQLLSLPQKIGKVGAQKILDSVRKKKALGFPSAFFV